MSFLASPDTYFSLMGVSGAGKTYLTIKYLEAVKDYNKARGTLGLPNFEVVTTATTKKAAGVLYDVLSNYFTSANVSTIHSYLGLTLRINYNTGEEYLTATKRFKPKTNAIIFIDEASYVGKDLYRYINKAVGFNTKVVFIGDDDQLLLPTEKYSSAFHNTTSKVKLETTKRQPDGSKITELAHAFRKTLYGSPWPNVDDYLGLDVVHLNQQQFLDTIQSNFLSSPDDNKVICYTNDAVIDYNNHIRSVLGSPPNEFLSGETVYLGEPILTKDTDSILIPADSAVYINPTTGIHKPWFLPFEYTVYSVTSKNTKANSALVAHPRNYAEAKKYIRSLADAKNWKDYFNFKSIIADIRLPYAITAHKSQGSTYTNVFIDLDNMSTCYDKNTLARLLYVGISRATTKVYLYGSLYG